MDAIRTNNLTKTFEDVIAVNDLTLTVPEGEIFGLVGPSGAGKTTILRLLTSIMEPTSGKAWVSGFDIVKQAETIKEKIGYLSQKCGLYPDLTVMENLEFYADIYCVPRKQRVGKLQELLEFSNLSPFKTRLVGNLSGGMKQKLGLACALIHSPKVLFLDEPTNGVNPLSRRELWRILYKLMHDKVTILIATSDMEEAERCSRLGFMHKGKMIAHGSPKEMRKHHLGTILEIRSNAPRPVFACLHEKFKGTDVRQCGSRIHIVTENADETRKQIDGALKNVISEYEIRPADPSLEDVFISLISQFDSGARHGR